MSNEEAENPFETRRSRRNAVSDSKTRKQSVLDELKQARANGKTFRARVDDLVQDVYMEVDDAEYQAKRRDNQGFVEDDDGAGYYDEEDSENERENCKKETKREKKVKPKMGTIKHHFQVVSSKQKTDEKSVRVDDDDILKECLADLVGTGSVVDSFSLGECDPFRKQCESTTTLSSQAANPFNKKTIDDATASKIDSSNELKKFRISASKPTKEASAPKNIIPPSNDKSIAVETPELDISAPMADDHRTVQSPALPAKSGTLPFEEPRKRNAISDLESPVPPPPKQSRSDNPQPDVLNFYFLDAFEDVYKHPGTVYLFGYVSTSEGKSESCCLVLKNISRQLFFVKRETSVETGNPVDRDSLYMEVQRILQTKFAITNFKCKPNLVSKKFISADESVPRECACLEVWVTYNFGRIPADLSGDCFSHVMNTTTTALERLLVEREIYGPCWLEVRNAVSSGDSSISHCPVEYVVDMDRMKSVQMAPPNSALQPPPISMVSINILTALNAETKESQIVMASLIHYTCHLDKSTQFDVKQMLNRRFCVVARIKKGLPLPFNLDEQLKANGIAHMVRKTGDEQSLLNVFLAKLEALNPDMIVGHDLNAQLSLLHSAFEKHKLKKWDKLGRLKRSIQIQRLGHYRTANWELTAGRLCLDSKSAAMELVRARSYEMGDFVESLLKMSNRSDLSAEQISEPFLTISPKVQLMDLIRWNWNENFFAMKIVEQMNAIPLFVQITQIVGGVLSRTLMGGRAERNEYLLLHACFRENYVPPDKQFATNKFQRTQQKGKVPANKKRANNNKPNNGRTDSRVEEEEENGDVTIVDDDEAENQPNGDPLQAKKVALNKKAQYAGGLVLEPKKGLYDTYIVLLDFNSLYPSIIQEFNICFTTVDKAFADLSDLELPFPPGSSRPDGILKNEIQKLVNRRREVKKLMNKEKPGTDLYKQYNIRQMGLKLTANSMYGCLGFANSRFYAKTLAAMVTAKGRELLTHTKTLVENENFPVIYGDTDSIMVNTNTSDFRQAKQIGYKMKQVVNRNYSLLELDIDGLYKRLLLLKKKKYAALAVDLNDENVLSEEMKGLDIVRRDWSVLAKDIGEEVVHLILSSNDRDMLAQRIRETLSEWKVNLDAGNVPLEKFEILRQLTREPSDYKDAKSQPHAQVAARLNKSKKFRLRQGDIVKYIICQDGTNSPATQRAYHSSEIMANNELAVDTHYYMAQQIHPVVARLCEPIEEIDPSQIAEAIGLDPSSYRRRMLNGVADTQTENGEGEAFLLGKKQDFTACEGFSFECPICQKLNVVRSSTFKKDNQIAFPLAECIECTIGFREQVGHITTQLAKALREYVRRNIQDPYVCDEVTCSAEIHVPTPWQITSEGLNCHKCQSGIARKQYSYKKLYTQQCFLKTIVDLEDALSKREIESLRNSEHKWIIELYAECDSMVRRYLDQNAFNMVDLVAVFAPLKRIKK